MSKGLLGFSLWPVNMNLSIDNLFLSLWMLVQYGSIIKYFLHPKIVPGLKRFGHNFFINKRIVSFIFLLSFELCGMKKMKSFHPKEDLKNFILIGIKNMKFHNSFADLCLNNFYHTSLLFLEEHQKSCGSKRFQGNTV